MHSQLLVTVLLGFKSLWLHKLRSFLTVLGIMIGVMSVVWLLSVGEGISEKVQEQIRELGATNIMVRSIKPPMDSSAGRAGSMFAEYGIKRADYQRIVSTIPSLVSAIPIREFSREFRHLHRTVNGRLVGCTPEYLELNHLGVARGRFLSKEDLDDRANYAVLADTTAEKLFPYEDPVGKSIQIGGGDYYVIIGQTNERMPSAAIGGSLAGQDFNLDVYIPITTWRTRIGDQILTARVGGREGEIVELSQVTVTVSDVSEVMETKSIIESLLRMYHRKQDWGVTAPLELLQQARIMRLIFNIMLGLIATISLVVGGIGIMNIMLATVTERTREIGIRRALGAKRSDITRQFLVETTVLSAIGGSIGALGGLLCYPVVVGMRDLLSRFFPEQWKALPPVVQTLEPSTQAYMWSIPVAFAIAVGIGIMFGMYPARRAAQLDPIEALRHE